MYGSFTKHDPYNTGIIEINALITIFELTRLLYTPYIHCSMYKNIKYYTTYRFIYLKFIVYTAKCCTYYNILTYVYRF